MNTFLTEDWVEKIDRLAIGFEPIDAALGNRMPHPFLVILDDVVRGLPRPAVQRHDSCLHVLVYDPKLPNLPARIKLRFVETPRQELAGNGDVPRRFVPRLISFPLPTAAAADAGAILDRVRRPFLFPGAAYEVSAGVTGLRGRVTHAGKTARWARVVATVAGNGTIVGLAHGDDRGEFLLLINPVAGGIGALPASISINVSVSCPANPGPVPTPQAQDFDPFWDLPEEQAQNPVPGKELADSDRDPVSAGVTMPGGFTAPINRLVTITLGIVGSEPVAFAIP